MMTVPITRTLRCGLIVILGLGIAACDPKPKAPPPGGGVVVTPARQEDQFGVKFGSAYRELNDSEPYSPADGDIAAISLTAEPVEIK